MPIKLVAAAIIISKGKVLLARRKQGDSHGGFWEFPGGAVEPGETLEECLARELMEELGVASTVAEVIARNEHRAARGSMDLVALRAHVASEEFRLTAHDAIEWVSPRDLGRYRLAPADVPIAAALGERTDLFQS
ncbi:MAG: (deoxy)nucleoside triphosphate pyrophosphohydrolase [Candidatus Krumholzibacteria bacterium]|nr:(deoxy)nucleoside triphosphate pyrophosphohydrolase [Candidatus Krumholzibacteria bacterium]